MFSKNLPVLNVLYVFFVSPYFDHDAFMHHTMHVLDAPGQSIAKTITRLSDPYCSEYLVTDRS